MADSKFDVVFRGDIVAGHNINDVKARLAQLFKVDAARIEALFAGGIVPLKRNLDQVSAEKYKAVLLNAGAQVQIRSAGADSKRNAPLSEKRPAAARAAAKPSATLTGLTLAPAGSDLLGPDEREEIRERKIDLSEFSLRPMGGDLLDVSEKQPAIPSVVNTSTFELADVGVDLLEGFRNEALPSPELDPEFDLAEPGADLLPSDCRRSTEALVVDVSHLDILPLDQK
ncbi:hypothetical protein F6455_09180 [Proteobacteria bacterium 005FR1]|nr:hypothetical protein [Proteobacteria bacterium 005FR1]